MTPKVWKQKWRPSKWSEICIQENFENPISFEIQTLGSEFGQKRIQNPANKKPNWDTLLLFTKTFFEQIDRMIIRWKKLWIFCALYCIWPNLYAAHTVRYHTKGTSLLSWKKKIIRNCTQGTMVVVLENWKFYMNLQMKLLV